MDKKISIYDIPVPFLFHYWKHYGRTLTDAMSTTADSEKMKKEIAQLGTNQIDIYIGGLHVSEIIDEISGSLKTQNLLSLSAYRAWFTEQAYHLATLSDGSAWVLTPGHDAERYIHIHPGKQSMYTMRVHANIWKTALICNLHSSVPEISLAEVNDFRKQLGLSPVKSLKQTSRLSHAIRLVYQNKFRCR